MFDSLIDNIASPKYKMKLIEEESYILNNRIIAQSQEYRQVLYTIHDLQLKRALTSLLMDYLFEELKSLRSDTK